MYVPPIKCTIFLVTQTGKFDFFKTNKMMRKQNPAIADIIAKKKSILDRDDKSRDNIDMKLLSGEF